MKVEGLLLLGSLFALGCRAENVNWGNPTEVCEAPAGACWAWECGSDGCLPDFTDEIDPAGFPDCPEGQSVYASWAGGRFIEVFVFCAEPLDDGHIYWEIAAAGGRPLLCEVDGDCPQSKPSYLNECVDGLCQNKDTDLYDRDVITQLDAQVLCFAGFTRVETVHDQDLVLSVLADIDAACPGEWDTPCEGDLPDYCWRLE